MARKNRRRTRKRNKKGGSVMAKMQKGLQDLKTGAQEMGRKGQEGYMGLQKVAGDFQAGLEESTRTGSGGMLDPVSAPAPAPAPIPLSSPPPMEPRKEKQFSLESPYLESKEKKAGGLLGLGWFGLGGSRLSHSSFINKMLRVRNKTKRNKAIRKYLKGGKKKTRKRKTKRRGGMNPQGGDNNLPRPQPEQRQQTEWERLEAVRAQHHRMQERRIAAARKERDDALRKEGSSGRGLGGGKRKRKNKTKKRRRRR